MWWSVRLPTIAPFKRGGYLQLSMLQAVPSKSSPTELDLECTGSDGGARASSGEERSNTGRAKESVSTSPSLAEAVPLPQPAARPRTAGHQETDALRHNKEICTHQRAPESNPLVSRAATPNHSPLVGRQILSDLVRLPRKESASCMNTILSSAPRHRTKHKGPCRRAAVAVVLAAHTYGTLQKTCRVRVSLRHRAPHGSRGTKLRTRGLFPSTIADHFLHGEVKVTPWGALLTGLRSYPTFRRPRRPSLLHPTHRQPCNVPNLPRPTPSSPQRMESW